MPRPKPTPDPNAKAPVPPEQAVGVIWTCTVLCLPALVLGAFWTLILFALVVGEYAPATAWMGPYAAGLATATFQALLTICWSGPWPRRRSWRALLGGFSLITLAVAIALVPEFGGFAPISILAITTAGLTGLWLARFGKRPVDPEPRGELADEGRPQEPKGPDAN